MGKSTFTRRILAFEGIGFGLALSLLWLNEWLDVPHWLLSAPATPVNWRESVLESAAVLGLGVVTISWTHHALARIQHLEGLLNVCMFCKRILANERWIPIEEYITEHSEAVFSHGLCPECQASNYSKLLK